MEVVLDLVAVVFVCAFRRFAFWWNKQTEVYRGKYGAPFSLIKFRNLSLNNELAFPLHRTVQCLQSTLLQKVHLLATFPALHERLHYPNLVRFSAGSTKQLWP
jgi:hypothetical protein